MSSFEFCSLPTSSNRFLLYPKLLQSFSACTGHQPINHSTNKNVFLSGFISSFIFIPMCKQLGIESLISQSRPAHMTIFLLINLFSSHWGFYHIYNITAICVGVIKGKSNFRERKSSCGFLLFLLSFSVCGLISPFGRRNFEFQSAEFSSSMGGTELHN